MKRAIAAVEGEGISVRRTSELYHVPHLTLHDRISGRVEHGVKPGPSALLTLEEEEELVGVLIKCARIGHPHTRKQVMTLGSEHCQRSESTSVRVNASSTPCRKGRPSEYDPCSPVKHERD